MTRVGAYRAWSVLLGLWLALPASGQAGHEVEVYPYGTVGLQWSVSDGQALRANQQRRGNSPFSRLSASLFADVTVGDRLTVFNHVLIDPSARASINSFLRTWARYTVVVHNGFDLHAQLGKIPTPFGNFTERSYTDTNPLLGFPLMYHYASSLRSGAIPSGNVELLAHRGESSPESFTGYAVATDNPGAGLPMVYDSCWDYGGSLIGSLWRFEYLLAVTMGTLSDPKANAVDNNDGQQLAMRIGFVPFTGLLLRLSAARGPYLDDAVAGSLQPGDEVTDFQQRILGVAATYEWRHLAVDAEWATNRWESPHIVDALGRPEDLTVDGSYLETRYKLAPGWYVAGRWSALRYGDIDDGTGVGRSAPWDWDVDRIEVGTGYWITDGVLTRLVVQHSQVDAPGVDADRILATQMTVRF
jgi:hypothetical protein